MLDLDRQIARVVDEAVAPVTAGEARARARAGGLRGRRSPRPALVAMALVVLVALAIPLALRGGHARGVVHVGTEPSTTAPAPDAPAPGSVIGTLDIPDLHLHRDVREGADAATEVLGPMHLSGTPLPGSDGSAVIVGHRTTHGAPFYRLDELDAHMTVEFRALDGTRSFYVFDGMFVVPAGHDDLVPASVLDRVRDRTDSLTLVANNPKFSAAQRLVVTLHRDRDEEQLARTRSIRTEPVPSAAS